MHVEPRWDCGVDRVEKLAEFDGAMPPVTFADDSASGHFQGGKERRRAMPHVIVGTPFDLSGTKGSTSAGGPGLGFAIFRRHTGLRTFAEGPDEPKA